MPYGTPEQLSKARACMAQDKETGQVIVEETICGNCDMLCGETDGCEGCLEWSCEAVHYGCLPSPDDEEELNDKEAT